MKSISNESLLAETENLVREERRITLELLDHLREIESRMLFAEMGYSSMYDFCIRHLALSEGSAHRRIAAMRLVRDIPEIKESLEDGSLNLSTAATLQDFFRREKSLDDETKIEIARQVQGMSKRETLKTLFEISPQAVPRESTRVVSQHETEIKLVVSDAFIEKLERLRGFWAHKLPAATNSELLEHTMDQEIRRIEKKLGISHLSGEVA